MIGAVACAAWLYLLCARGGFWRCREIDGGAELPAGAAGLAQWPPVIAVVPARNEAEVIGDAVLSLLRQRYAGSFSIVVVDDASTDGTAEVARAAAAAAGAAQRLLVLQAPPLPDGWTGKVSAQHHAVRHIGASGAPPAYILFCDADIAFAPAVLAELVGRAEADGLVLNSRMALLRCDTVAERFFIPAFIFFFQMLYPFSWVNDPGRRLAAAAGGCMLAAWQDLQAAGGLASIRSAIIDDCALARLLKPIGPVRLVLSTKVKSLRGYRTTRAIREMIVRSAYAQLRFSPLLLAGTLVAIGLSYLAAPLLAVVADGTAAALGLIAWVMMAAAFRPTLRLYGLRPWRGVLLPGIAFAYAAFTVRSAILHYQGRGGIWKGRTYHTPPAP